VTFRVEVFSSTYTTFQWRFNGTNINAATGSNYTILNVQFTNAGSYSVAITNTEGYAISSNAVLTVVPPVGCTYTISPTNAAFSPNGGNSSFSVTAGVGCNWTATNAAAWCTITSGSNGTGNGTVNYSVAANNSTNARADTIAVAGQSFAVNQAAMMPPSITTQPVSRTNSAGTTATFNAVASGTSPFGFQWRFNGVDIAGATATFYSRANVQVWNAGNYSVVVTNPVGSVISSNALLTVTNAPGTVAAWIDNGFGQSTVPFGLNGVKAIAGGYFHSLALRTNGTITGWGYSYYGQATAPSGVTNVVAIAAGFGHSVALRDNGTVTAWGRNDAGETNVPSNLSNVIAISSCQFHSLALRSNGTVVAWGYNGNGQTNVPADLTNAVAIAAGGFHSLALTDEGTIVGWGENSAGELDAPSGLTGVMALAAGSGFSLALKNNQTVVAWGDNTFGQTNVPASLTNVIAIAAGDGHALALRADGRIIGWGNTNAAQTTIPAGISNMVAIAGGGDHSLALKGNGSVAITAQPLNRRVTRHGSATFGVLAAGNAPLNYVWRLNGVDIPFATGATYTVSDATNAGSYSVLVGNSFGTVGSSNATLTVAAPTALLLLPRLGASNVFQFNVLIKVSSESPVPIGYIMEASTNFEDWLNVQALAFYVTNQAFLAFADSTAAAPKRFYRVYLP
jgi:alpha-tubulin suppressor-like RCC1 family protein